MTYSMQKYPRTKHIEGSRFQVGDEDLGAVPFEKLKGCNLVVEEKVDGANSAVSFNRNGDLLLQSRGHYLVGGLREKHFNLFKQWGEVHRQAFYEVLGDRYVMFGEWVYAKHTVFYDALPHYFMEFDIFERETSKFLDTPTRHAMLRDLPVVSVPVLHSGKVKSLKNLVSMIGPSNFIRPGHIERMAEFCKNHDINVEIAMRETDRSTTMEGLYVKHEEDGRIVDRFKYVRSAFLQQAVSSGSHWLARPIIPNQLRGTIDDIFLPELPEWNEVDE